MSRRMLTTALAVLTLVFVALSWWVYGTSAGKLSVLVPILWTFLSSPILMKSLRFSFITSLPEKAFLS